MIQNFNIAFYGDKSGGNGIDGYIDFWNGVSSAECAFEVSACDILYGHVGCTDCVLVIGDED